MHMMSLVINIFSPTDTLTHRWLTVMAVLAVPSVLVESWVSPTKQNKSYLWVTFDTLPPTSTSQSAMTSSEINTKNETPENDIYLDFMPFDPLLQVYL